MKNINSLQALFLVLLTLLGSSCNESGMSVKDGYTLLDSGRAGFIKPAKSAEISGILNELKALNPHVVCVLKADTT